MRLKTSHVSRPKIGELANGDEVVVRQDGARSLIAVIDALGHGPGAAEVAQRARAHLEAVSLELDVKQVVEGLHRTLRGTRGAAAMVCILSGDAVAGCGVGNVDLRAQGNDLPVVLSPGVLGGGVRQLRIFSGQLSVGSRLVLFSDGISSRASLDLLRRLSPQSACEAIVQQHAHSHDDATVLIADREG